MSSCEVLLNILLLSAAQTPKVTQLKIGILQTGYPPEDTIEEHGSYALAFENLLSGYGFEFSSYAALEGVLPESIHDADGWLITGSKFGAYEELPWIAPLENFAREAYDNSVPIVGICFGHQLLAQALGGRVEKFNGGWSVGRVEYNLAGHEQPVPLYAWHQDQVVTLPPDASVSGSTPFCKYASLTYGNKAWTLQPHPEFTANFFNDLFEARKKGLPESAIEAASKSVEEGPTDSSAIAETIATFFKTAHNP